MEEKDVSDKERVSYLAVADFSPDGKTLLTASLEGTLAEWDGETGRRRRILLDPKGVEDENPRVVCIEDGREVEAPFQLQRLSERMRGSSLLSVRFSADGQYFAVGAANGEVVIWNARSRGELIGWRAHEADVVALDFSPDRRWLATGALEEGGTTFRVWRIHGSFRDATEAFSDGRHVLGVWTVCFSPDGRLVAAGGRTLSGFTAPQLFEVESGKHFGWLHWDMTRAMQFSPDGEFLVTGDEFGNVKLWRIEEHKPTYAHRAYGDVVRAVGFSPDGSRFFSAGNGGIKVWDTKSGQPVQEYGMAGRVLTCRYSGDGLILHVASAAEGTDHPDIHRLS